ncbi:hypothetical protein AOL_s00004g270 [Orbilia oligospora ATCC 24927]|uniref:CSN8/PSMD8/EIF3K domain-containing protein n=1 Tax=Arthrobotrys oligospora (strain ATCC 24927 / CBS 115.81 / DSM 1491) TaxID=756982 RepID=G1WYB0_ARTOA|nr:hypothetical protein AOL_s00004g270 [Orbilia oligospora ATCC 24927]EGX54237.1 hypothetical protein AOL_s00004g270 [Orbilia oligospora ATCC 24927]
MFKRQAHTPTSSASIAQAGMVRSTKDWSKTTTSKPLEYGLASKGDTRLADYSNQESFFHTIQTRYLTHIGSFPSVPALDEQLAALSIASNNTYTPPSSTSTSQASTPKPDLTTLQNILMDMRKLREGLLASNRQDDFAKSAYLFIVRAAILMSHPESYFPSIRHLLYVLHKQNPLSNPEINELAGYLMLHLACSTNSYHDAYEVRKTFRVRDHRVDMAIKALVAGDYWLFWSTKKSVDGYKSKIMDRAVKDVRKHALKCVGSAYHTVDIEFLEGCTGREWEVLKEEFTIAWEEDAGKIVIRKRPDAKGKTLSVRKEEKREVKKEMTEPFAKPKAEPTPKPKVEASTGLAASRWATPKNESSQQKDSWTQWG